VSGTGKKRKLHKVLVGNPEESTPLGKSRSRLEDGIKLDLMETGWEGEEWTCLALDREIGQPL
jgi:hypothetical protein